MCAKGGSKLFLHLSAGLSVIRFPTALSTVIPQVQYGTPSTIGPFKDRSFVLPTFSRDC